jgi:glutathione S-transferase
MYKLYYAPSTASTAIHWMLIELDVPFELSLVDFETNAQKSSDYLAINPNGTVPTLVVDGAPHAELAALLMLLAERHPQAGFDVPPGAAARADYLQWMVYLANTLQPAYRAWFYADEVAGADNDEAAKDHARARIEAGWSRFDGHLGDGRAFMLGETMTAVDFLATILARWSRSMPKPATAWRRVGAYIDRMRVRPGLREVHAREGLTDWIDK